MLVKVVRKGFESEAELLKIKQDDLVIRKELAKEEAIKKVEEAFAEEEKVINDILSLVMVDEEVEDPVVEEAQDVCYTDEENNEEERADEVEPVIENETTATNSEVQSENQSVVSVIPGVNFIR